MALLLNGKKLLLKINKNKIKNHIKDIGEFKDKDVDGPNQLWGGHIKYGYNHRENRHF
jgi:hypothetical protein